MFYEKACASLLVILHQFVLLGGYTRWTKDETKKINDFFKEWITGGDGIPGKSESLANA